MGLDITLEEFKAADVGTKLRQFSLSAVRLVNIGTATPGKRKWPLKRAASIQGHFFSSTAKLLFFSSVRHERASLPMQITFFEIRQTKK